MSSIPTESRIKPSGIPAARRSSVHSTWLASEGGPTTVSTWPSLARRSSTINSGLGSPRSYQLEGVFSRWNPTVVSAIQDRLATKMEGVQCNARSQVSFLVTVAFLVFPWRPRASQSSTALPHSCGWFTSKSIPGSWCSMSRVRIAASLSPRRARGQSSWRPTSFSERTFIR